VPQTRNGLEEPILEANATVLQGWEIDQLLKLRERQPDLLEPAVKRLVQENEDIRWSVVVGAYEDKQINLGKAAELLDLPEIELRDRFIDLGIPLRVGPSDPAEARAEVEAVRAWFADETGDRRS
jgi:predicted HTH domain antitoxin